MVTRRGVRISAPQRLEDREKEELALTPVRMTTNLRTHLWAAGR